MSNGCLQIVALSSRYGGHAAERWWINDTGNRRWAPGYPYVWTTAGALVFVYALSAACGPLPTGATVGAVASRALKLWWLRVVGNRDDQRTG